MAESLLNVFFGTLDSIATWVLIYKIFRWPFWRDFNKLLVLAVIIAIVSFADRTVLGLAEFDTAIQFVLYVLFLRYIIKVGLCDASLLSAIGYVSFLLIQVLIYKPLLSSGIVSMDDAEAVSGLGTFIIQASTETSCFIIAALLYVFRLGFSSVDLPPHDSYTIENCSTLDWIANVFGAIAVMSFTYWLLNHVSSITLMIPLLAASLSFLLFLLRRKDYKR
ncbi:hypothetical protein [Paenibacillus planticolens]|uniref:Uncharacterized protein n=1 Tax=Paenibacillus planticolens TaxID=2654976 RepID=A0ABX1ZGC2_9BACL|nr:hypothetical protein [Paenibacillus planticolens]NOU98432.1 hypothetical protein [Paenibacillus planticolens]